MLWSVLLIGCSALTSGPLDELSSAAEGDQTLILGWVAGGAAPATVEITVTPDGGAPVRWRQAVGGDGRVVGKIRFSKEARVALSADRQPQGEPVALSKAGSGIAEVGSLRLYWEIGKDLPAPLAAVDARPGPPDGWLTPQREGAGPLVIGMAEQEAEQSYKISGSAIDSPRAVTRGLGGLVKAEGGGVRASGLVTMRLREVASISFLRRDDGCAAATHDLTALYGPPNRQTAWVGGRHTVSLTAGKGQCAVSFAPRLYGDEKAKIEAEIAAQSPKLATAPIAAVDAQDALPAWVTAPADLAPLRLGMPEADLSDSPSAKPTSIQAIRGVTIKGVDGKVQASASLKEGVVRAFDILYPDPGCAQTQALMRESYGPMSSEDPLLGAKWEGSRAWVGALPSGENSCVAQWHAK